MHKLIQISQFQLVFVELGSSIIKHEPHRRLLDRLLNLYPKVLTNMKHEFVPVFQELS